ncbi:MAG: TonB family protein [Rickettsiales bacterium]
MYYLTRKHFLGMMFLALLIHAIAALGWILSPGLKVNKIPVHVLNIKLGAGELLAMRDVAKPTPAPKATRRPITQSEPVPPPYEHERMKSPELPTPKMTKTIEAPKAAPKPKLASPTPPSKAQVSRKAVPMANLDTHLATMPQQYVRQMGNPAGVGEGSALGNSTESEAEVVRRYEQLISVWIQRHKTYPAEAMQQGVQGKAIIRIRIDRTGRIKYFKLQQRTGSPMLDEAVIAMVRAANPVPPVPANYPAGNLIEFLIPISYKLR